ncbi:MAG: hypothetical protein LBD38_03840 [Streptococcaceae bacterium]|jgi:hypothetical protein|nr:hypothetical protein [Streptococcaceae bacterium]
MEVGILDKAIENLFQYRSNRDKLTKKIQEHPEQVVTTMDADELTGVAVFWEKSLHPNAVYIDLITSYDVSSKSKVYAELYEKVMEKIANTVGRKNIHIEISPTKRGLIDFCKQNGFKRFRFSFNTYLNLSFFENREKKTTGKVYTLRELKRNLQLLAEFLCILEENYEETHRNNPLKEMNQEEWLEFLFQENPVVDVPAVLVKGGHVASYAVCFELEETKEPVLSWVGTEGKDQESLFELMFLLGDSLLEKGYKKLFGRFETTDEDAMYVLGNFPFEEKPMRAMYQKKMN